MIFYINTVSYAYNSNWTFLVFQERTASSISFILCLWNAVLEEDSDESKEGSRLCAN